MIAISVNKLSKSFRTFERREGVRGAVRDLFSRTYRTLEAVDKISFEVEGGELLGYIGPNGAGKSTSIKMLTGILRPTAGEMSVLGFHPFRDRREYTRHIGVVFGQRTQLWWDIAVIESLRLLGHIYEVPKEDFNARLSLINRILAIEDLYRTPVRKLSLGQRVRCDLAASLIHHPRVLFLDEPTIGLDAVAKDGVRTFLRQINRELGTTIILTTHDLKEIEELCQRIIVIDQGHLIFDGSLAAVKALPGLERRVIVDFVKEAPLEELRAVFAEHVRFAQEGERRLVATFDQQRLPTIDLIRAILAKYEVLDVTINEPDIEQVVMKIYREGIAREAV
jgi:ABC-2 type transport system ATP-binding protein